MPRVIYSLLFKLESAKPSTSIALVVPLNADGQSVNGLTKAVSPKRRVIDLRVGDWLTFRGQAYKIVGVQAYRDAQRAKGVHRSEGGYEIRAG
jgi:uncharacterized membrane protein